MKPRLLDLYCGAGGATRGYQEEGFYVVGVDRNPQPNYCGDEFLQADAIEFLQFDALHFDVIHASPPCQAFSLATSYHPGAREGHENLIPRTRMLLHRSGLPYVIENVSGAPVRKDLMLCGEMFGLGVHRHRYFEIGNGVFVVRPKHRKHKLLGAPTNSVHPEGYARLVAGNFADVEGARAAMGIDWMGRRELAESIPPAYTRFIGKHLMDHLALPVGSGSYTSSKNSRSAPAAPVQTGD